MQKNPKKRPTKEIPEWPVTKFNCANPKKTCLECQKGRLSNNSCQNDSAHTDKSAGNTKYMRVYPSAGDKFLFACDCGELSGYLTSDILHLWLRTAHSDVMD